MVDRNQAGEIVFHYSDDTDEVVSALKEIFSDTEIGKQYIKGDYIAVDGTDGYEDIVKAAVKVAGGPMISTNNLAHALTLLIDSGEFKPKSFVKKTMQLEDPAADERPRDKNGKLLTAAQLKWSEYRQFVESGGQRFNQRTGQYEPTAQAASTDEINRRKQSDPEFRQYVVTNLRNELLPAEDGIPQVKKTRASAELVDFGRKYRKEPIENLRPKGGFVKLDGEQIPWSEFQNLMNKATAAGVI